MYLHNRIFVKDRKPEKGESKIQVHERRSNGGNSLDAVHGNICWCHPIVVLIKHIHMLPAPQKPIIMRGNSGTNLIFHLSEGKQDSTICS